MQIGKLRKVHCIDIQSKLYVNLLENLLPLLQIYFDFQNLVNCPNVDLDEDDQELVTNIATGTVNVHDVTQCDASLSIRHAHESSIVEYEDLNLGGKRQEYPNLKKGYSLLRENVVLHVESFGCACWEMFDLPRFRGESELIEPGDRHYLSVRTGSLQRILCPENDDK